MRLLFTVLLLSALTALLAQVPVHNVTVQDGTRPDITEYALDRYKTTGDTLELHYYFDHLKGGVQKANEDKVPVGPVVPATIEGYGLIRVNTETGVFFDAKTKFLEMEEWGGGLRYLADPTADAVELASRNWYLPLKTQDFAFDRYDKVPKPAKAPDLSAVMPEPRKTYVLTKPSIGNTVGKFTTISYTLKEGEDAEKRLLGGAYKMDYSYIKKKDNTPMFGGEDMDYKSGNAYLAPVQLAADQLEGYSAAMGGLRYKKDKSKEDNEAFEKLLLVWDAKGELVKRTVFPVTDEAWHVTMATTISSEFIHPEIGNGGSHAVFMEQTSPSKKEKVSWDELKFTVVDFKTGEVTVQQTIKAAAGTPVLINSDRIDGTRRLYLYYPGEEDKLLEVVVTPTEVRLANTYTSDKAFLSGFVMNPAPEMGDWNFREGMSIPTADGGRLALKEITRTYKPDPERPGKNTDVTAYVATVENAAGEVTEIADFPPTTEMTYIGESDKGHTFLLYEAIGKQFRPHVLTMNAKNGSYDIVSGPEDTLLRFTDNAMVQVGAQRVHFVGYKDGDAKLYYFNLAF